MAPVIKLRLRFYNKLSDIDLKGISAVKFGDMPFSRFQYYILFFQNFLFSVSR